MKYLGQEKVIHNLKKIENNNSSKIENVEDIDETMQVHSAELLRLQTMKLRPHLGRIYRQKNLETADFIDYLDLNNQIKESISSDLLARMDQFKKYKDSLDDSQI